MRTWVEGSVPNVGQYRSDDNPPIELSSGHIEAALQAAADANGGYIGPKIVRIVKAALSSVQAGKTAEPGK